jgi:hypothetical protein
MLRDGQWFSKTSDYDAADRGGHREHGGARRHVGDDFDT